MVDRNAAEQKVRGPAIGLLVTAVLGAFFWLGNIVLTIIPIELPWMKSYQDVPSSWVWVTNSISIVFSLLGIVVAGVLAYGAFKFMRLESYAIAVSAAILAMIPCVGCCIVGLPIGIWALIVMHAPDVRPAFVQPGAPGGL